MLKNNQGFTLIEMLIVLLVISVLIILIIPNLSGKSKEIGEKGCEALVSVVQTQVDAYYLEKGELPSNLDTLASQGYIKNDQKSCQNNKSLLYNASTGIVSAPEND